MANFGYSFNGESTQIHPDKLQAYRATDFRIDHTPQVIVLSIGYRSEPLSDLFVATKSIAALSSLPITHAVLFNLIQPTLRLTSNSPQSFRD
jgi:hypothetical protein